MGDLEAPLFMPNAPPSFRKKCLTSIANATSQCKLTCLVLAWIVFAITGYVLVLLVLFQFIILKPANPNLNSAVLSSFNVSTGFDELYSTWDMNLYFKKDIQYFEYRAKAWVYSGGEFISVMKLKGQESLVQGNFTADIEDGFNRDKGVTFDLFVQAEVTVFSNFRWAKKILFMIDCCDLKIKFPINKTTEIGTLSNGAKTCRVQTSPSKMVALDNELL